MVADGEHQRAVRGRPGLLRARARGGAPRWVWDDTARWYPPLLAAGVRVAALPRPAAVPPPAAPGARGRRRAARGGGVASTGTGSARAAPADRALFALDDAAEHLRADLEDARQLAAVAAVGARRAGSTLLLAAESAGALVAAEMTHAGVPWRVDVHERLLADLLGPRPPRGARPARAGGAGRRGARRASTPPASTPTRGPSCWRRCGAPGSRWPTPGRRRCAARPPGHRAAAALQAARPPVLRPTAGPGSTSGCATAGSARRTSRPGRRTGRWSSNGGGALSIPVQVRAGGGGRRRLGARRGRRRPARAARARRDERRPRARPGRRAAPTSTRAWSTTAPSRPATTPSSACSARCTAPPAARAGGWSPA